MKSMDRVKCENCGHVGRPIAVPNPPVQLGEQPTYDVLCAECRFIIDTVLGQPVSTSEEASKQ